MAQEPIWPGSGSAVSGNTPFGFYDTDSEFQTEAPKFATWCAQRLGYPLMNVELQDKQFLNQLPSGNMGKLRRYKSGKMELVIGQYVFDVTKGPSVHTYREMVHIDVKNGQFERMGDIQERLIVSPNIELLLGKKYEYGDKNNK